MISSIASSLSALSAYGKKMEVASNNVANWQSEEFKKSRAVLTEGEHNTVAVQIERIQSPGPLIDKIENGERVETELSNVDLAEEIPQTTIAHSGYAANLKTVKTQDEILESLIDIVG